MTLLGDDFRKRAEKNNAEAATFFDAADFKANPKTQTAAVISKITANMLYLLGETVDYLRESETIDASGERRKRLADRNDAIRKAYTAGVAGGDFTNYDQLVKEFVESAGTNGD